MGVKEQLIKVKDNWLLIALILIIIIFFNAGSRSFGSIAGFDATKSLGVSELSYIRSGITPPVYQQDFAPDVQERRITKSASLSSEVELGKFKETETRLKRIVKSSNGFLLNENVNRIDTGRRAYLTGSFEIKVRADQYDYVIAQLNGIGKVMAFTENSMDITNSYVNTQIELDAEKERLERYETMYNDADEISDKINLNDRIFDQERKIKYMEDALANNERSIEYSTIYVILSEKRSGYADVAMVKFSELVEDLVSSINTVFHLFFVLLPYSISAFVIWIIVKLFKKGKGKARNILSR